MDEDRPDYERGTDDMTANTARGYPYPVGTDRVMDGDDVIHSLADKVNDQLGASASGSGTLPAPGAADGLTTLAVTFPVGRFVTAPLVFMQATGNLPQATGNYVSIWPTNPATTTGFTANMRRGTNLSAVPFHWFAVTV